MTVDASLLDLPPELVVRIASYLTTPELGPLRRSCKKIEQYLFTSFAKEFFTKRQFMIEHESLEALVGIANHPGLASRLTEVIIGTHAIYEDGPDLLACRLLSGHVERDVLIHSGRARDMLADAFSKLPHLRTVGLRDYDGAGRVRDGDGARWRSWGWSITRPQAIHIAQVDAILPLILSALAVAQARPTNIEVFLRRRSQLSHKSFMLPACSLDADVIPVLRGLKTLMLAISGDLPGTDPLEGAPWLPYDDKSIVMATLKRFLHHTPSLKSLRLNFQPDQYVAGRLLEWLGQHPTVPAGLANLMVSPIPPVQLTALTSLELGMANVPGPVLLRVLTKFNLQTISIWKMTLHCPPPSNTSRDCWGEFFGQLSAALSVSNELRTIMIGHISQFHYHMHQSYPDTVTVSFVPGATDSADKEKAQKDNKVKFQAQYTGKTATEWLQELSMRTFVPGIHTTPRSDGEDSSSGEETSESTSEDENDD